MSRTNSDKLIAGGYFIMAALQVVATWQGLEQSQGLPRMLAMVGGGLVGAVPILGSATGMWGAMAAWGWSFLPSLVVFFWYVPAILIVAALEARATTAKRPA
jgi:hypothetical protein